MNLSILKLSFCLSLLFHGAVVSVFYVVKHAGTATNPALVFDGVPTLEIVLNAVEVAPDTPAVPTLVQTPSWESVAIESVKAETKPVLKMAAVASDERQEIEKVDSEEGQNFASPPTAAEPTSIVAATSVALPMAHMDETKGGQHADYWHNPKPAYPREARRLRQEGVAILRVMVTTEGNPESVELRQSSGFVLLDKAALEALKHWRFVPAQVGDLAVNSWVEVPVRFKLVR